jgi:hypothetical protein
MVKELILAPTPEEFLREMVNRLGEHVIPGYDYLDHVHAWNDSGWFDLLPIHRNGRMSAEYRINMDGLNAMTKDHFNFAHRLGLKVAEVYEIVNFYRLKYTER